MDPLVSVRVITYNQERFLGRCLEGVLAQRTNFPFEIVLGEDCSTDRTGQIARDYAARFPESIRLITAEKNVGGLANARRVREACRGRYHALCEGDDYWIDPLKLQKQVDFLEAHPDHVLCFHDALITWADKSSWPRYYCPKGLPASVGAAEVIGRPCFIPTASILMRETLANHLPVWDRPVWCPDLTLRLWAAHQGRLGYLDEIMAVRQRVASGMTSTVRARTLFEDTLHVYRSFDRATGGQYAALIGRRIRQVEQEYREVRQKQHLGYLYLALNPGKLVAKLRDYAAHSRW